MSGEGSIERTREKVGLVLVKEMGTGKSKR